MDMKTKRNENSRASQMRKRFSVALAQFLLGAALFGGPAICQAQPQTSGQSQSQTPTQSQSAGQWAKDPAKVKPMRKTTNTQRRAAAERSASRRAAAKQKAQNPQGGAKQ